MNAELLLIAPQIMFSLCGRESCHSLHRCGHVIINALLRTCEFASALRTGVTTLAREKERTHALYQK